MAKFLIKYKDEAGDTCTEICEFETTVEKDGLVITAADWADDRAYALARKGWYEITRI